MIKKDLEQVLKVKADSNEIAVGFFGRVARIARVHQLGLKDQVTKDGPIANYERRPIIGFTELDKSIVQTSILKNLNHL